VSDAFLLDGIGQCLRHVFLAYHVLEALGPVLAGYDLI
jgi:hypothetical protein